MEYKSHPDKKLVVHLQEVLIYGQTFLKTKDRLSFITCVAHDFGKYTTFFQNRLEGGPKGDQRGDHSFISAIFGAYLGMEMAEEDTYLPLFAYQMILCHHGNIKNLDDGLFIQEQDRQLLRAKLEIAEAQRQDMCRHLAEIKVDYHTFGLECEAETFLRRADLEGILEELKNLQFDLQVIDEPTHRNYFRFQRYYSALIAADKFSASDTPFIKEEFLSWNRLNEGKKKLLASAPAKQKNDNLDRMRTDIFNAVHEKLPRVYRESNLFSITSATGTGKTLCGFLAAVKLRELLGDGRKIVYGLPFTSIIEQNYDDLYFLMELADEDFRENCSAYLVKHHSLADVTYQREDYPIDKMKAEMLLENWSSGVVVTTFVQIMETLIGNRNRMLKKFHSLRHSILLLDEVQALPAELLKVVDFILRKASEEMDCKIIMMTATKPILLQGATELLDHYESYFKQFSRTSLWYREEKVTVSDFARELLSSLENKSYLIICNTIQESLDLYKELEYCGRKLYYLSANLLPIHRKKRIGDIEKSLAGGEAPIVVSTQVVEAGVNFDFDCVVRDIGPLAAVIQAAGRGNRHGKRPRCAVQIRCICSDNGKLYGEMVYGHTMIAITREIFGARNKIPEEEYLQLIETYFKQVNANMNQDASGEYMKSVEAMNYTKGDYAIGKFSLIKETQGYLDVFLQVDDEAQKTYEKFLDMLEADDMNARHMKQLEIRRQLAEYTLSIPARYSSRINHMKEDAMWTLPREGCEMYYSEETGFKRGADEFYMIF